MLCNECKNKSVVRGIKQITCLDCYKEVGVNYAYGANICEDCSNKTNNCVCCGSLIENSYEAINMNQFRDCDECGYEIHVMSLYGYNGKLICSGCIPENYRACDECGSVFPNEDTIGFYDKMICVGCAKCAKDVLDNFINRRYHDEIKN